MATFRNGVPHLEPEPRKLRGKRRKSERAARHRGSGEKPGNADMITCAACGTKQAAHQGRGRCCACAHTITRGAFQPFVRRLWENGQRREGAATGVPS